MKQSLIISRSPPDNLPIFLLKISSCTNNFGSIGKEKGKNACSCSADFPAWLIFFLYMVFVYTIFRNVREAYTVAVIHRSLSKQAFFESRQNIHFLLKL